MSAGEEGEEGDQAVLCCVGVLLGDREALGVLEPFIPFGEVLKSLRPELARVCRSGLTGPYPPALSPDQPTNRPLAAPHPKCRSAVVPSASERLHARRSAKAAALC
mgnify:CR=1 FL=1